MAALVGGRRPAAVAPGTGLAVAALCMVGMVGILQIAQSLAHRARERLPCTVARCARHDVYCQRTNANTRAGTGPRECRCPIPHLLRCWQPIAHDVTGWGLDELQPAKVRKNVEMTSGISPPANRELDASALPTATTHQAGAGLSGSLAAARENFPRLPAQQPALATNTQIASKSTTKVRHHDHTQNAGRHS